MRGRALTVASAWWACGEGPVAGARLGACAAARWRCTRGLAPAPARGARRWHATPGRLGSIGRSVLGTGEIDA